MGHTLTFVIFVVFVVVVAALVCPVHTAEDTPTVWAGELLTFDLQCFNPAAGSQEPVKLGQNNLL